MTGDADLAAQNHIGTELAAAGDADLGDDDGMVAHDNVVGNLDQVVDQRQTMQGAGNNAFDMGKPRRDTCLSARVVSPRDDGAVVLQGQRVITPR